MSSRTILLTSSLVMALGSACAPPWRATLAPPSASVSGPSVGLIAEGTAFERSGVRDEVIQALERATQRWVVSIEAGSPSDQVYLKGLQARLAREERSIASYDGREPRCASESVALAAVHRNVDAVYRVSLELSESARPAGEAEAKTSGREPTVSGVLGAVGLVRRDTVVEETLSGTITLIAFGRKPGPRPVRIARKVVHVEPAAWTRRMDVGAVLGETLRDLPAVQRPEWDAFARRLLSTGCPLLATTIYEGALGTEPLPRDYKKAALAAMTRGASRRAAKQPAQAVSGTRREPPPPAEQEPPSAAPEAPPAAPPSPEPPAPTSYSCATLCELHMVELCNRDTVLWNSHRKKWEPTRCGTRRDEPFLTECYQQQWATGAFHNSCVVPCEATSEGRERLRHLLQGAGCLSDNS
jgi:hypothetical protein